MSTCVCGHRLGIHEYPYACRGAVGWDGDCGACDCFRLIEWDAIKADREGMTDD